MSYQTQHFGDGTTNTVSDVSTLYGGREQGGVVAPPENPALADVDMGGHGFINVAVGEYVIPGATIADVAALPEDKLKAGYIFRVEDRANAYFKVVEATGGNTFNTVQCTTATSLQLVLQTNGVAVMNEFGNAGSGDWAAILQACFDYVGAGSATTVKINPRIESYTIDSDVSHLGSVNIIADGVTIDATAGTFSSDAVLSISGSLTQIEELSVDVDTNDGDITLDAPPSLVDNDVFIIYNPTDASWSGANTLYRAGEFCRVDSIAGNVVTLWNGLYDSYAAADVDLHKLSVCDVSIKGLNIIAPSAAVSGLAVSLATSLSLDGVKASNSTVRGISLSRCYNVSVTNTDALVNEPASGTQYGISINNCSNVSVIGSSLCGIRYSLNLGGGGATGSVTNRNVRISGLTLFNGEFNDGLAAGIHGNVEDVHYNNCSMRNGAHIAGKNVTYSNCTIYGQDSGVAIKMSELKGGNFKVSDCTLITHVVPTDQGVIHGGATLITDEDMTLEVVGCTFQAQDMAGESFVRLDNTASLNKINLYIGGGCSFQSTTAAGSIGDVRRYSGALVDSDFLIVDGIVANQDGTYLLHPDGNFSALGVLRLQSQSFKYKGTTNTIFSYTVSNDMAYKYAYPRLPTATLAKSGRDSATLGRHTGGTLAVEIIWDITTTGIQVGLFTENSATFLSPQQFDIHGSVSIKEV